MDRDLIDQSVVAAKELRNKALGDPDELVAFVTANKELAHELLSVLVDTAEQAALAKDVLTLDQCHVDFNACDYFFGYCIAQCVKGGLFNKPAKVLGGIPYPLDNRKRMPHVVNPGDADQAIWWRWQEAEAVLNAMDPEIRNSFRIYPVAVLYGMEPKLLKPRDEEEIEIIVPEPMPEPTSDEDTRCPYCKESYELPDVAAANCENYGTTGFNLKHSCGNIVRVSVSRGVTVHVVTPAAPGAVDDFTGEGAEVKKA